MLIYKEFLKNTKMSKMLLGIGFIKLLIFRLFSKIIRCNTESVLINQFVPQLFASVLPSLA